MYILGTELKIHNQMYRVTIRATQDKVPQALVKLMEGKFSQGLSTDDGFGEKNR